MASPAACRHLSYPPHRQAPPARHLQHRMNYKNMGSTSSDPRPPVPGTPLARQLSVYSLTFDEFQSTIGGMGVGKDFGSMNMDEFLKNIWTAEETQAIASASAAAAADAAAGALQRQGSLTLPRTLSQKTVDEVWRDFANVQQQQQLTLGEMTLEEFLVRAGVVREDMNQPAPAPAPASGPIMNNINTTVGMAANNNNVFFSELPASNGNPGLALGFGQLGRSNGNSAASLAMSRAYPATLPLGNTADLASPQRMRGGAMVGIGDPSLSNGLMHSVAGLGGGGGVSVALPSPTNRILSDGLAKGNGDLSSLSPTPYVFSGGLRGRKNGAVEKVVERRQKRMIKNRESAARSRARKQAYTMELEAEIAKLKEQNEELEKKQAEIMEMQKTQSNVPEHNSESQYCGRYKTGVASFIGTTTTMT